MKAGEDLVIIRNKNGVIVPYKSGDSTEGLTFKTIKKETEIPKEFLKRFVERNIEKISDVIYVDKYPINIPKELGIFIPPVSKTMKIKKRKYSQDSLNVIYDEKGFSALKKIGEEFEVTDRSSKRLIIEILRTQEERQRAGLWVDGC